jgi:hypothetical protein
MNHPLLAQQLSEIRRAELVAEADRYRLVRQARSAARDAGTHGALSPGRRRRRRRLVLGRPAIAE